MKELLVEKNLDGPAVSLYCIKYEGGGELPRDLSGNYTSPKAAQAAIDAYKASNAKVLDKKAAKAKELEEVKEAMKEAKAKREA